MVESFELSVLARKNHSGPRFARSSIVKRSVAIGAHRTSVSLEDAFWKALKEIAILRETTLSNLITSIDAEYRLGNLSSSIRLFILDFYRGQLKREEHAAAQKAAAGPPFRSA